MRRAADERVDVAGDFTCASTPEPVSEKPNPMLSALVSAVAWFEPFAWTVTWDAELTEPSRRAVTAPPIFDVAKKTPPLMMPTPVEWVRQARGWRRPARIDEDCARDGDRRIRADAREDVGARWISAFATAPTRRRC